MDMQKAVLFAFCLSLISLKWLFGDDLFLSRTPSATVSNPGPNYSLVNSIDHHPKQNLFCVTFTHNDKVILYTINQDGKPDEVQCLHNPEARLNSPQHAVFSPDGKKIAVANWHGQTIAMFQSDKGMKFHPIPAAVVQPDNLNPNFKPHGITFSPCGKYLAVAYGAEQRFGKGIVLYKIKKNGIGLQLIHVLNKTFIPGIPKGIAYSPDGTCLLVTFADVNQVVIYNLSKDRNSIDLPPRQVLEGANTGISRPEDIKITPDGNYCAISNSTINTVTFYHFDKHTNLITHPEPCELLENPEAGFNFPHGLAFTPDGSHLLVTEFGSVEVNDDGHVFWPKSQPYETSKFNLYKLNPLH